jgi:hypothetical protein
LQLRNSLRFGAIVGSDWEDRAVKLKSVVRLVAIALVFLTACAGIGESDDASACWSASYSSYEDTLKIVRDENEDYDPPLTEEQMSYLARRLSESPNTQKLEYTNCMMDRGWKCIGDPTWGEDFGLDLRDLAASVDGWTDAQAFQCRNADGVVVDMPVD